MKYGFLYQHPRIYDLALYGLYRGAPHDRFRRVADEIPEGASVVDLCAGTGFLHNQLRDKNVRYLALDINPTLVAHLQKSGIDARVFDVSSDVIPQADIVTMCSSLYHFHPHCADIIQRMRTAARHKVVILEPVHNAVHSRFRFVRWLGEQAGKVNGKVNAFYFSPDTFQYLTQTQPGFRDLQPTGGGRDMLAIFDSAPRTSFVPAQT